VMMNGLCTASLLKKQKNVLVIVQNKGMTSNRMYALMYCPPAR